MRSLFTIIGIFLYFLSNTTQAQELPQGNCGVGYEEGLLIREQMFRNRATIDRNEVEALRGRRFTIWIPLVIHIVGNSQGLGFASPGAAVSMVCRLNNDFADQNLQFYIKDSIHFVKDDTIYMDAYDSIAIDRMILLKDTTAANIFINGSAGGGVAGYYSRRGDYVFLLNGYANAGSTTATHEFGHFFTLPHTFFGWEGTDARFLYYATPAPDSILDSHGDKRAVEYVARSGSLANCYSSGDGFCDTDADYISERAACPLSGTALDPSGAAIHPNSVWYMSYFYDNCMDSFSAEQKVAIMTDVINRGWTGFSAPNVDTLVGTNVTTLSPIDASLLSMDTTHIHLEWDVTGASGATAWVVEMERMIFGTPVGIIVRTVVNNQNHLDIPISKFMPNNAYRWRVMPFSSGYTCAAYSTYFTFNTADLPSGINHSIKEENFASLVVMPNPVHGNTIPTVGIGLSTQKPLQGSLRLYGSDGRLLMQEAMQTIPAGGEVRKLDVTELPAGIYHLVLVSDSGNISTSFILSK